MGPNREAVEAVIAELSDAPVVGCALARTLASEIDLQAADPDVEMNAALVGRYIEVIGGLASDDIDDPADPIGDVLSKILDEAKA